MKTIGIIGGISWHSTVDYYRIINEAVQQRLGGVSSAKILLYSLDYQEIKMLTFDGNWAGIAKIISGIAQRLELAGADCLLLGANTMHHIADLVQDAIHIPLIHIADTVAKPIAAMGIKTVALLGTKYTMELGFYSERLARFGIQTVLPGEDDRAFVNHVIYEEMGKGLFLPATKSRLLDIIATMYGEGIEGAILGCTEIPMMIKAEDSLAKLFDTGYYHAMAAVDFALG